MRVSLTLPLVSPIDKGRPRPSQIRCSLQLKPPRERPRAWSEGSASPRPTHSRQCAAGGSLSFDSAPCVHGGFGDDHLAGTSGVLMRPVD